MKYLFSTLAIIVTSISIAYGSPDPLIEAKVNAAYPSLEKLYHHLHAHPELSFQEEKTALRLGKELEGHGFEVSYQIGGHGIVAVLKNGPGETLLIRTDLDALPILEKTGLPYASTVTALNDKQQEVGVMHACGHDAHMAIFAGTAQLMADLKDRWSGTLVMIGQPAEERGAGARAMLKDGLFEKFPLPDYCLALHVAADLEAGKVGYCKGYTMANVDTVDIVIHGKGGHGAAPHKAIDPVVIAAQVVTALQTIVSRELDPVTPAVVTVGSIHGGTKHNIIPDSVTLQLTVRSYSDASRAKILTAIKRIAKGTAEAAGVPQDTLPVISIKQDPTPALYNDPALTEKLVGVFQQQFGADNVVERQPEMIGEDFARYGKTKENIPICMFRIGTIKDASSIENAPSLHSAHFAPLPEPTIKTGVHAMTAAALSILQEPQ